MALIAGVQYSGLAPGAIVPCGNNGALPRTLVCNGSAVSRTVYAALFAAIGTSFGSGDGSTTFNLPDFRGRFLRGVDGTASNDPDKASRTAMNTGGNTGNSVGSVQGHAVQNHTHAVWNNTGGLGSAGNQFAVANNFGQGSWATQGISAGNSGSDTRPVNAYVNYCIAY
jgi:microcystin-dependent protein